MPHPRRVHGKNRGFPYVVEQGGAPQFRLRRDSLQGVEAVLPHVVAVVVISLVKAHHGQHLRPEHTDDLRELPQYLRRALPAQQFQQLRLNALGGDVPQQFPVPADGCRRFRFDGKAQHRREPQSPQDTQGILVKSLSRLPYAAQDTLPQVLPASEGVPDGAISAHGHGVDGEVPPPQVLLQGAGEGDRIRPPVVPVSAVHPVGGHLHAPVVCPDGDGAVLQARGEGMISEQSHGLLRPGAGGHVPVLRCTAQQRVPDAASHAPGLMACRRQGIQYNFYIFRYFGHLFALISVAFPVFLYYNEVLMIIQRFFCQRNRRAFLMKGSPFP